MLEFIGRLHPLILHLPIGVLVFCGLLEVYIRKSKQPIDRNSQSFSLLVASVTSVLSIVTGLLLVRGGDYSGDMVNNHKWVAIGLGVSSFLLLFAHEYMKKNSNGKNIYSILMVAVMILLGITGHLGGSITHGENFLLESSQPQFTANVEDAILYQDVIAPILKAKCNSCHNPSKLKGELDMSSPEMIMKGGENGFVINLDKLSESPMIMRAHLPMSDDKHMPPEGKKQLTGDELQLLEWWITSGAQFDQYISEVADFDEFKGTAEKFLAPPEVSVFDRLEPINGNTLEKLKAGGLTVETISQSGNPIYANLKNSVLEESELNKLRKVKKYVGHLNLSDSKLTDDQVSKINKFANLQKLELQNTSITSKGINKLKDLNFLQSLNLFNTDVDSTCIDKLLSFPQLKNLYLWETEMTPSNIEYIRNRKPRLNVIYNINKGIFTDASLKPPVIQTASDIFTDSMEVSLNLNFKNVNIYYTLDGSEPDSNSLRYEKSFGISATTIVKAIALKKSWDPSGIVEKQLVKSGVKIENIKFHNQPHSRYKELGQKSLTNLKLGSLTFSDGEWVGYEGQHGRFTLQMDKTKEINSVVVGALESPGSYIFYPKTIEVEVSKDGKRFQKVATEEYPIAKQSEGAERKNFLIKFEKQEARWVKLNILSHLKNPEWHPAPGAKCWIFLDELIIN